MELARGRAATTLGALAAVAAVVGACHDDSAQVITPVIDQPIDDPDATATALPEIALTVAHAHSDRDLVSQTFVTGEDLVLPGVPFGDDLVMHMSGFIGASTTAYGRTCEFAVAAGAPDPKPHLFFSRTVKFGTLPVSPLTRLGGLGVPYLGAAMLVSGSTGSGPNQDVEMYDPATATVTTLGRIDAREQAVYALIGTAPPRVVVLGGVAGGQGAKFIELLDGRQIDRFDFVEAARVDLTATSLTDGRVMVIGGKDPENGKGSKAIDEVSDKNGVLEIRKLPAELAGPRSAHTATRLGDDVGAPVLIAGGVDDAPVPEPIAQAELFRPLNGSVSDPTVFKAVLQVPRSGHVATLMPDGSVLIIGGIDKLGLPVVDVERFTVDGGFIKATVLPASAGTLDFTATTLPDGRILLTGGRLSPNSPPLDTAYIVRLDPSDGSVDVVQTDHMALARAKHQAVLLCDGTVLITGGVGGQFAAERYNPPPAERR